MKKLLLGAALIAVLATPAVAQSYQGSIGSGNIVPAPGGADVYASAAGQVRGYGRTQVRFARSNGLSAEAYAPAMGNWDSVSAFGHYQGTDPDPNVRLELRRDDVSGY